jgi:hypothetical protein
MLIRRLAIAISILSIPMLSLSAAAQASTKTRTLVVPATTSPNHPISTGINAAHGATLQCSGTIIYQTSPSNYVAPCVGAGKTDQTDYANIVNGHSNGLIYRIGNGRWHGMASTKISIKGNGVIQVAENDGLKGCPTNFGALGCFADNSRAFTVHVTAE